MRKSLLRAGLVKQYAVLFFVAIMVVAMGITMVLLNFSSEKFTSYELKNQESSMVLAVNDIENQYDTLSDVAHQIRSTSSYRPGILRSDAYREIELLKDFSRFVNYSPLISQYFLFYQNSQKIYTSEGRTSYFSFYAASALQLDGGQSQELFNTLNTTEQELCLTFDGKSLLAFPIRFVNVDDGTESAVLCFIITQQDLKKRMGFIAATLPDQLTLSLRETVLLDGGIADASSARMQTGVTALDGNRYRLAVTSDHGFISAVGEVEIDRWPLLLSSVPQWLYICIVLALLIVSAVAALLARAAVRPLRRLIRKYAAPADPLQNEFEQLDQLVARIEEENQNSARLLRDRTLLMILHGYYSERLLSRWGFSHLNFDKRMYCAAVIGADSLEQAKIESTIDLIESSSDDRIRAFALYAASNNMIAAILGFDDPAEKERVLQNIQYGLPNTVVLFVGEVCDTPQRLSVSYLSALTALQHSQSQETMDAHSYAVRLVAAAEADNRALMEQLHRQVRFQYDPSSAILIKKFAMELSGELSALAADKQVPLDRDRLNELIMLSDLELLLKDAEELVCAAFFREPSSTLDRQSQTANAIVSYINAHAFDPDLSLSDVGARFDLSNDYASAMVKNATGLAFKEYLTDLRMRRACALLLERRDMTVTEISEAVGYRKPSNFIRKFKDIYGVTPAQYR